MKAITNQIPHFWVYPGAVERRDEIFQQAIIRVNATGPGGIKQKPPPGTEEFPDHPRASPAWISL
jgi:hypothetical protein